MALSGKKHGKDLVFKLDTQAGAALKDISAWVQSVDGLPGEAELADITCGGATGYAWLPGFSKADITLQCVFDDAAFSAYEVVKDFLTDPVTTRSYEYGPAGLTAGYAKVHGECHIKKVTLPSKPADPLLFTIELVADGVITVTVWT